jgi:hypothetical protein
MNPKLLWKPKLEELPESCRSCPFRANNNKEFGEVVTRLRNSFGMKGKASKMDIAFARFGIYDDVKKSGDFICHGTTYNVDMTRKDCSNHRQCAGATKYYREHHEKNN